MMSPPAERAALRPGIYAPLPTFFDEQDELDLGTYGKHLLRLVQLGIFPLCAGSLGEASHLDYEERGRLIRYTRSCLDENDLHHVPVLAGVGGSSTRQTIELAQAAASAGANVGMVILPSYYAASLKQDPLQIEEYYVDICKASPIPILLYNFPANSAGLDIPADVIQSIMARTCNLCGVKLTCSTRLDKLVTLRRTSEGKARDGMFTYLDGMIDDLPTWVAQGGHGTVSGVSNIAPAMTCRIWELSCTSSRTVEEDLEMSVLLKGLATFDAVAMPLGVRGLKHALGLAHGYPSRPRRPLLPIRAEDAGKLEDALLVLMATEKRYIAKIRTL